jgi:hypothetical protein
LASVFARDGVPNGEAASSVQPKAGLVIQGLKRVLLIAVFLLVVVILLAFAVIEVLIPLISPLNEFSVAAIISAQNGCKGNHGSESGNAESKKAPPNET